jgi:Protein of unknown function (DUF3224)
MSSFVATGTFVIDSWEQDEPYDDAEGARLTRAHVVKSFAGDVAGTSRAELMMVNTQQEGSDAYVAVERFSGSVHGKEGTFVLQHSAVRSGDDATLVWAIVPDSGTAALRTIRGTGTIAVDAQGGHSYTLEYELD